MGKADEREVAQYMKDQLAQVGYLYQDVAVSKIEAKFGREFVYVNANGNPAISRSVLAEFKKLTPEAVWERGSRCWRRRESYDDPDKRGQH